MCEALGSQPLEEEVPQELEDLPIIVQTSLSIYESLRDEWDYMGGNYIGKNLSNIFEILKLYSIPDEEVLIVYKIISIIDNQRRAIVAEKVAST